MFHNRIEVTPGIAYGKGARGKLDICRPAGAIAAPVVVFFYGGGWRSGSKGLYRYVGKALARRGYVAVVPDYRIYPEVRYPSFIEDAALAVRWVIDNGGRFGGDTGKLFVMGHSAGAHIAAMLAVEGRWLDRVGMVCRDIAGLIGISGPYDFMPLKFEPLAAIFGGADRPETQPIFHVAAGVPPALLMTGARDRIVEPGNSTRFAARLRACGNEATVVAYPRIGHFTIIAAFAPFLRFIPVVRDVDSFIARTLQPPQRLKSSKTMEIAGT